MNVMKGNITLIGIALVAALVLAPIVMANIDRITPRVAVTVHNVSGGATHNALLIGDANGTVLTCVGGDGGFNPTVLGDVNATFSDRNGMINYIDNCADANHLIEFACGKDVNVNGGQAQPTHAYAFNFNCADLNKVCSAGRCV